MDDLFIDAGERVRRLVPQTRLKPPVLLICGDAEAGRSTLTAALTGLPVQPPERCPFLVRIDYGRDPSADAVAVAVNIVPASGRSPEEKAALVHQWAHDAPAPLETLAWTMEDAAARIAEVSAVAESDSGAKATAPFMDTVRISVSGPYVPRLSIVDLPYIEQLDRVVVLDDPVAMLPVVSLRKPLGEQKALAAVLNLDRPGRRTLAVVSHVDTAGPVDAAIKSWAYPFDLHLLVNLARARPQDFVPHDAVEDAYYTLHAPEARRWGFVPPEKRGITALRNRLGAMLGARTAEDAGLMASRCERAIADISSRVLDVAQPVQSKRRQLVEMSSRFEELMTAAVKGDYDDANFFDADDCPPGQQLDRRIGAAVNDHIARFAERLHEHGRAKTILEKGEPKGPHEIKREDYLAEVQEVIRKRQGWELAGMFNPGIVSELMKMQSRPWKDIAESAAAGLMAMARRTAVDMLSHVMGGAQAPAELADFVAGRIATLECEFLEEIKRLSQPPRCSERMLSTLTDRVKTRHNERRERDIRHVLRASLGSQILSEKRFKHPGINYELTVTYPDIQDLQARLEQRVFADLETSAASAALDYAEEYYAVSVDRFIDQVAEYAVEKSVLGRLPTIFTPLVVSELADNDVDGLLPTGEMQRGELLTQLAALQDARDELAAVARTKGVKGDIYKLVDPTLLLRLNAPAKVATAAAAAAGWNPAISAFTPRISSPIVPPCDNPDTGVAVSAPEDPWHVPLDYNPELRRDYPKSSSESENEADDENSTWVPGSEVPPELPLPFLGTSAAGGRAAEEYDNADLGSNSGSGWAPTASSNFTPAFTPAATPASAASFFGARPLMGFSPINAPPPPPASYNNNMGTWPPLPHTPSPVSEWQVVLPSHSRPTQQPPVIHAVAPTTDTASAMMWPNNASTGGATGTPAKPNKPGKKQRDARRRLYQAQQDQSHASTNQAPLSSSARPSQTV
jgi:hypothetical protein